MTTTALPIIEFSDLDTETQKAFTKIDALDLAPIKWSLVTDKYGAPAEMTHDEADIAIEEYRMLLKLWTVYEGVADVVMSRLIDEVWHTHILDTSKYTADMLEIFGSYKQHFPYFGVQGPEEAQRLTDAFSASASLFLTHFGVDIVESSQSWTNNQHRRNRAYYLANEKPASTIDAANCGEVRCCNACGKCSNVMHGDPAMAELYFGARPRA